MSLKFMLIKRLVIIGRFMQILFSLAINRLRIGCRITSSLIIGAWHFL